MNKQRIRITDTQVANLHKLGDYLESLPVEYEHFDIRTFTRDNRLECSIPINEIAFRIDDCGSCACGIGHGPIIGLFPRKDEDWWDYGARVFGADNTAASHKDSRTLWSCVFDGKWEGDHNHHHALVKRLDTWLKDNGYPSRKSSQTD